MNGSYIGDVYSGNTYPPDFSREIAPPIPQGGTPKRLFTPGRRIFAPGRRTIL